MKRNTLVGMSPRELQELAVAHGQPRYRGRQLAQWIYGRRIASLRDATNLPRALREELDAAYGLPRLEPVERSVSPDGTAKLLFELHDGARIESVAMPRPTGRTTYCLSSQVGCRMACVFCATGRMGIVRQLSPGEIVGQVLALQRLFPESTHPNLVFMGMGEPLDNLDALLPALEILMDPEAIGLSARRITVSTSGLVDGIRRLSDWGRPVGLAVSLTTGDPEERERLMPVAGRVPLDELLAVAADHGRRVKRKVTLECAIIAGRNDTVDEAERLLSLARTGPFKVNLIPLNPIHDFEGGRPDLSSIDAMADVLWRGGVVATVRDSQGREVDAACGQLVRRQERRPDGAPRGPAVARRR
ncbi:MAG TPA: 23S rRNA (adenine(2503)-C(2))-methyltransferase RlmN [Candidatus Krumholzibacteria bacterium]|nr:23S rRNA (adenine(2503)-C(2))-methyltransferase RlmN [Candidatus Krumholzibacteria bacterium]